MSEPGVGESRSQPPKTEAPTQQTLRKLFDTASTLVRPGVHLLDSSLRSIDCPDGTTVSLVVPRDPVRKDYQKTKLAAVVTVGEEGAETGKEYNLLFGKIGRGMEITVRPRSLLLVSSYYQFPRGTDDNAQEILERDRIETELRERGRTESTEVTEEEASGLVQKLEGLE